MPRVCLRLIPRPKSGGGRKFTINPSLPLSTFKHVCLCAQTRTHRRRALRTRRGPLQYRLLRQARRPFRRAHLQSRAQPQPRRK